MRRYFYVMLMTDKNKLDSEVVKRHVEHLKKLDEEGKLVLCGPFSERGGMVVLNVPSYEAADGICKSDPFISGGYKTYELRTLEVAEKSNNYLL